jgi:hypothetical protein
MLVTINGFSRQPDMETLHISNAISNPVPTADFELEDTGSQISINCLDEVVIIDESAYGWPIFNVGHNLLVDPVFANGSASYTVNALTGVTPTYGYPLTIAYTNATVGTFTLSQITQTRLIWPNQQYMLSCNITIGTPLVGSRTVISMQWLDAAQAVISTASSANITSTSGMQRFNVSGTAPSTAKFVKVRIQVFTSNATNSGTCQYQDLQLEPMTFINDGLSYPSKAINTNQPNVTILPNSTNVRQFRLFGGYVTKRTASYDGPNRVWKIECSGYGWLLAGTNVSGTYKQQNASTIVTSIIDTYLVGKITHNNVPFIGGAFIDQISWDDTPIKDAFQTLADSSGQFFWYVDAYGNDWFHHVGFYGSKYNLSTSPDNIYTFPFYEDDFTQEASQFANDIKVVGGTYHAGPITDSWTGDGVTTVFPLTQSPFAFTTFTMGGVAKKVGIDGVDASATFDALVNKTSKQITFTVAPGVGVISNLSYTYDTQAVTESIDPQSVFDYGGLTMKKVITDSSLTTLKVSAKRGLAELSQYSRPRPSANLKTQQYFQIGKTVQITHQYEGLTQAPYIVQQVDIIYKGTDARTLLPIHEYSLQLGALNPDLVNFFLHFHKNVNRGQSNQQTVTPEIHLCVIESAGYSDSLTHTP